METMKKQLKDLNLLDRFLFSQGAIYDAEVQKENTGNLPKRSRLYQGMIDSRLLEPGEVDFNHLNDVYVIIIAPFDLFGYGKYRYTFDMQCREMQERIAAIKSSEEIGVKYMQEWEEKIIEKRKAREEGLAEGRQEGLKQGIQEGIQQGLNTGKEEKLLEQIRKKLSKGQSTAQIADALEEDENTIIKLVEKIKEKCEE